VNPARASILPMAEDLYADDYQRCRNSSYLQAWRSLNECEEKLCRANAFDTFGPHVYNSLGRMGDSQSLSSRVMRVRDALDRAQPQAWQQISDSFASLKLGVIWPILIGLASDIALYVGGGAASGAALWAAVGFFFGGIGAIPGALAGASIGTSAGLGLLNWIGIASLAKDLAHAIPQAIGCYVDGIKTAWGPEPERSWRSGGFNAAPTAPHSDTGLVFQASHQIAQGHVILIAAILMAIMAYVTRGKGDKVALLTEMRNSPRLGPKMADWVQANEAQFPQAMAAMESRAAGKGGGGSAKAAGEAQTPSQASGRPSSRQSEVDVGKDLGAGAKPQASYKDGKPVAYGTQGSVRPDFVSADGKTASFEVKNYNVETNQRGLIENVSKQAVDRAANLPDGMKQNIVIDVRGQVLSGEKADAIVKGIVEKSGGVEKWLRKPEQQDKWKLRE
jgi:hypothetical protein